jgi:hypothetical protein
MAARRAQWPGFVASQPTKKSTCECVCCINTWQPCKRGEVAAKSIGKAGTMLPQTAPSSKLEEQAKSKVRVDVCIGALD